MPVQETQTTKTKVVCPRCCGNRTVQSSTVHGLSQITITCSFCGGRGAVMQIANSKYVQIEDVEVPLP